jgi:hypothetical protein
VIVCEVEVTVVGCIDDPSHAAGITVLTKAQVCIGYLVIHDPRMQADVVEHVETG